MRQDHRFRKEKGLTAEQKRLIPVVVLPVIAVLLIVIILIGDHKENTAEQTAVQAVAESAQPESAESEEPLPDDVPEPGEEPESVPEPGTEEETVPEGADPYETDDLRRDSMPELLDIMKRYFAARTDADAETINELYGITGISDAELQAEKVRLMSNSKYISSFDDVATYVMQGTDENNWLVYTTANIRFYTAQTKAPMIMWCFIKRDEEGSFRMLDSAELPSVMLEYAEEANHSDAVRKLAGDINAQLNQALDTDADLKAVYGVLRSGSPVYETEAEVVVVDESAGETENAAENETAPETQAEETEPETQAEEPAAETQSEDTSPETQAQ